jgi:hypothetical protein
VDAAADDKQRPCPRQLEVASVQSALDEEWIRGNSEIAPEKLHAIGVIAFAWNQCEKWLFHLFADLSGLSTEDAWRKAHDWDDGKICARIKLLLPQHTFHQRVSRCLRMR